MKDIHKIREHVAVYGGAGLSEQQILTLLFGSEKARKLLDGLADTRYLLAASEQELVDLGLTPKQAEHLHLVIRLTLRLMLRISYQDRPQIREPEQIYLLLKPLVAEHLYQEQFWVVMLDTKVRVVATKRIALGTLDAATISAREVFRVAIQHSASSVITAHNHPSGDPTPSSEDIAMCKRITEAGELIGIPHLDHVVIGDETFRSLRHMGHL